MADFNELRIAARRARHKALSSGAAYVHPMTGIRAESLNVKLVVKPDLVGDMHQEGFAQSPATLSYLRFSSDELDQQSVVLARGGNVTMPDGTVLILGALMPSDGPINVVWQVVPK